MRVRVRGGSWDTGFPYTLQAPTNLYLNPPQDTDPGSGCYNTGFRCFLGNRRPYSGAYSAAT